MNINYNNRAFMTEFLLDYNLNPFPYNNLFLQIMLCFCGIIG